MKTPRPTPTATAEVATCDPATHACPRGDAPYGFGAGWLIVVIVGMLLLAGIHKRGRG